MGSQLPLARRTKLGPRPQPAPPTLPRQLDLVLDDVRLWGMAPPERQAVLRSLARLLLEASSVATREAGDEHS
jgi:hypothetical protein